MDASEFSHVKWPYPWKAIENESEALSYARDWVPDVAGTILGELHREISSGHALFGVDCVPVAYDAATNMSKDFLLATELPDAPLVLVHLTWQKETDPRWPSIRRFASVDEFVREAPGQ